MKYKLPRQVFSPELTEVISREMKKQKMTVLRTSKNMMKELAEVLKAIKEWSLPKHLVCKKLPHDLGHGIFLRPDADPIQKGEIIGPYAGDLSLVPETEDDDGSYAFAPVDKMTLKKEEQSIFDKKRRYHPKRLYSLKLDALKNGNFTRFINHSEKPNIEACLVSIPRNTYGLDPAPIEIIYMAKKTIKPGEQLLISYEDGEKTYWAVSNIKPFPMTPKTFQVDEKLKVINPKK